MENRDSRILALVEKIGELTRPLMYKQPLDSNAFEDLEQAARDALELSRMLNCYVNDAVLVKAYK